LWNTGQTTKTISNLTAGTYSVTVTDAKGCSLASPTSVISNNLADFNLAFNAAAQTGVAPFTATFTNSTPGIANYNFTWHWGDGNSTNSNNSTVFYTYQFSGLYDVVLIATNPATGCKDTLVKQGYILVTGASGCTHSSIVNPTGPISKCQGETLILTASTNATTPFSYQWNINSAPISGATSNTVAVTQNGYYSVSTIKNSCPVTSSAVQVTFNALPATPAITSAGSIVPCVGGTVTLTSSAISGGTYLWNTTQTTQAITVSNTGTYSLTVTNGFGCNAGSAPFVVNASFIQAPICLVTVDSTSTKNLIIWDKQPGQPIDSFRIYRNISGFKQIASVSYNDLSEFTDTTNGVNPNVQAYEYAITILDNCGNESPLSSSHRSIYQATPIFFPPAKFDLSWTDYQGFGFTQYYILRDNNNNGNWIKIDSVNFSSSNQYSDIGSNYPVPTDSARYIVEAVNPSGCNISVKEPNPMATSVKSSKSNSQDKIGNPLGIYGKANECQLKIYPNPSKGTFTVQVANANTSAISTILVYNVLGEQVYQTQLNTQKAEITIPGIEKGVYQLQVTTSSGTLNRKIVISK
jgi:hypothetical protein